MSMNSLYMALVLIALTSIQFNVNAQTYQAMCASCHGSVGEGNETLKAPAIAGLDATYLKRQLKHFKNRMRGSNPSDPQGQMMAAISQSISEQQIEQVSEYLSQLTFQSVPPSEKSAGFVGAGLYRTCQSCHGAKAQGEPNLGAPRLAGQHLWYLKKQLNDFKSGIRGQHPKDQYGQQMFNVAQDLPDDKKVDLILIHLSKLKPNQQAGRLGH